MARNDGGRYITETSGARSTGSEQTAVSGDRTEGEQAEQELHHLRIHSAGNRGWILAHHAEGEEVPYREDEYKHGGHLLADIADHAGIPPDHVRDFAGFMRRRARS
jgi:hypothetical protein